jgi:hypothetical protein
MRQRIESNQSNPSLFSHILVFLVLLSCFAHLYCFGEKSNRFSLMRPYFVPREPSSFCVNNHSCTSTSQCSSEKQATAHADAIEIPLLPSSTAAAMEAPRWIMYTFFCSTLTSMITILMGYSKQFFVTILLAANSSTTPWTHICHYHYVRKT